MRRLANFILGEDQALNALGGGSPRETLSGTVGRASAKGERWALWIAEPLLDALLGKGHCARQAAKEQARRDAEAGL